MSTITPTEQQLIEVSLIIGYIAECNSHHTAGLASLIRSTGKTVGQLTIDELIELDKHHRDYFNTYPTKDVK